MTWMDWLIITNAVVSVVCALLSTRYAIRAYGYSKDAEEHADAAEAFADRAAGCLATCERAVTKTRDLHETPPPEPPNIGERYRRLTPALDLELPSSHPEYYT